MRLIDADQMALDESDAYMAAQAQISDDALWRTNAVVHIKIQQLISDTPTVDAVPVVRCKDCKYWADEHGKAQRADGVLYARCRIHNHRVGDQNVGLVPTEDDFCRYGERKEEAND